MRRLMTKFWVESSDTCSVPGCTGQCVALDIMVADGKRCVKHVPDAWIEQLDRNAREMFDTHIPSKILNTSYETPLPVKAPTTLQQDEVNALLKALDDKAEKESEAATGTQIPKQ